MADPHFFSFELDGHGVLTHLANPGLDVNSQSNVLAGVTELGNFEGQIIPFIGAASIEVLNIAPGYDLGNRQARNGVVSIRINVLWDSDLRVRVALVIWP